MTSSPYIRPESRCSAQSDFVIWRERTCSCSAALGFTVDYLCGSVPSLGYTCAFTWIRLWHHWIRLWQHWIRSCGPLWTRPSGPLWWVPYFSIFWIFWSRDPILFLIGRERWAFSIEFVTFSIEFVNPGRGAFGGRVYAYALQGYSVVFFFFISNMLYLHLNIYERLSLSHLDICMILMPESILLVRYNRR